MTTVIISPQARRDLLDIVEHVAAVAGSDTAGLGDRVANT
jgi:plasmid stabilization system protein ParE